MKKMESDATSPSGIFLIEINTVSQNNQWVLDTGCGSHICIDMQDLRNNRRLNKGELDLCLGKGVRVVELVVGIYVLNFSNGLFLNLDDCYYVPALTKNITFASYLNKKGFHLTLSKEGCSIMLNDVFYASGTLLMSLKVIHFQSIFLINFYLKRLIYVQKYGITHQTAMQQGIQEKEEFLQ